LAADEQRSGARRKGDGEVREESTEKRATSSFGFTERGRASLPDAQRSGLEVKNGLETHVEAVTYTDGELRS
jgi:hypothetical protein